MKNNGKRIIVLSLIFKRPFQEIYFNYLDIIQKNSVFNLNIIHTKFSSLFITNPISIY